MLLLVPLSETICSGQFAKSLQPFDYDHIVSLLAVATTTIFYVLQWNCDVKKLRDSMYIYACPKSEMLWVSSVMYVCCMSVVLFSNMLKATTIQPNMLYGAEGRRQVPLLLGYDSQAVAF